MKSTFQRALLVAAVATLGVGAVGTAAAQSSAPTATPPAGEHPGHHHGHFGSPFLGTFLHALHQLKSSPYPLTATQEATIKTVLQTARQSHPHGTPLDPTVVGNPGNSGAYSNAVGTAVTNAQTRVTEDSTVATQLYQQLALSANQQTQLTTILASMKAKEEARHAQWAAKHATSNG